MQQLVLIAGVILVYFWFICFDGLQSFCRFGKDMAVRKTKKGAALKRWFKEEWKDVRTGSVWASQG